MHNAIPVLNRKLNLKMDPAMYTAHTLRLGGCTDMARKGVPNWKIEAQGRWSSKMWKYTYINMNWKDMADLRGGTVGDLLKGLVYKPYDD